MTLSEQTARPAAVSATFVVTADDLVGMSRMAGRDGIPFILVAAITFVGIGLMLWGYSPILSATAAIFGVLTAAVALVPGLWRFWLLRQAGDLGCPEPMEPPLSVTYVLQDAHAPTER